jgi:sortase (surface protein transpeptidase)
MQEGEVIIYHCYKGVCKPESLPKKREADQLLAKILSKAALVSAIIGVCLLAASYAPSVWFWANNSFSSQLSQLLGEPVVKSDSAFEVTGQSDWQPAYDPKLPAESRLIIPSIGVDTPVQEGTADNLETVLKKGPWRVSDFGTPADRKYPTILAAHRYGYLAWSNAFRRKNSFFNLPKLKEGDTIEIIWKQRKYVYAAYAEGKGESISDYNADLILYTCQTLNSSERIFKYARLLKI